MSVPGAPRAGTFRPTLWQGSLVIVTGPSTGADGLFTIDLESHPLKHDRIDLNPQIKVRSADQGDASTLIWDQTGVSCASGGQRGGRAQ